VNAGSRQLRIREELLKLGFEVVIEHDAGLQQATTTNRTFRPATVRGSTRPGPAHHCQGASPGRRVVAG